MKIDEFVRSTAFKVLLPIIVVWGIITIFNGGQAVGQWLYAFIH